MNPEQPVEVKAYAGARYPERPLEVRWQGAWRRVLDVQQQHEEPGRRCFLVRLEGLPADRRGDIRVQLCYDYTNDAWQACLSAGRPGSPGRGSYGEVG